jgi:AhpD family alkylhydroperoxidase
MDGFPKRRYRSWGEFARDLGFLFRNLGRLPALLRGESLPVPFRLRLMLVVTAVNACRYCRFFHARHALREGLDNAEVRELCAGLPAGCPTAEQPALLYARHWAERDGRPAAAVRRRLLAGYAPAVRAAVELTLGMIRLGNLAGNTFDYLLHRLGLRQH